MMLEARGLRKSFGALEVTRDVSVALPAGARHAVVGPNGSGKTTLFNLLTGELPVDAGAIRLDDRDVTHLPPDARARAGLTRSFQKNNLFPDLSVFDNLALAVTIGARHGHVFWRRFHGLPRLYDRVADLAARIHVAGQLDHIVRTLPYGTQRQVEIGLALAVGPKVLLLDEPTAGMSAEETRAMTALIAGLPRDIALLIIEHDMDVVFEIAERITVLDYGSVLIEGTPEEVRSSELVRRRYLGEAPA
ncbi:MAG: ABC transporter ATP-binding protein [Stellaceae bacterium]